MSEAWDEILPPLTPDFAKLMERLDFQTSQLDRSMSEYPDLLRLIASARHAIRYASDGEQGQRVLRDRVAQLEEVLREIGEDVGVLSNDYIRATVTNALAQRSRWE